MANTIEIYIDYIENQMPGLKSGDYSVVVTHTLQATGVPETKFTGQALDFSIRGERFNLKPADIVSVFPPPNSLGEHSSVVPQVVFARNTLPWERMIALPKDSTDDAERKKVEAMPWMALLVFNEGELEAGQENGAVMTLAEFRAKMGGAYPVKESDESDQEKLTVISIKKKILAPLLPSGEALARLCHARESSLRLNLNEKPTEDSLYYELRDSKGQLAHAAHVAVDVSRSSQLVPLDPGKLETGDYSVKVWIGQEVKTVKPETITITANDDFGHKVAIVPANRLPKPGARSMVHLVSLEERYNWDGSAYRFNFGGAGDDDSVLLVSLKAWSFDCVTDTHNFDKMLEQLIQNGKKDPFNTLRLPLRPNPAKDANIKQANSYLESGYVPLSHFFRRGGKSISWYRSPLLPGNKPQASLPVRSLPASCADALLLYDDKEYGMFDVSYAAAWELGRLMALRNKSAAVSLYRWKKQYSTQLLLAEQQELHPHLPYHRDAAQDLAMPAEVENWFSALSLLKGLPFNYLVPDERMLPKESFRFFRLDPEWIACLIDGAFSLGRVTSGDTTADQSLHQEQIAPNQAPLVSGFLLRSYVVKGWPTLQVDGYTQVALDEDGMDANRLKILRIDKLSPNVLLCLFQGDAVAVDIHQKPEALHLGFDIPVAPQNATDYQKNLHNAAGIDKDEKTGKPIKPMSLDTNWDNSTRVVNVDGLFEAVKGQSAALGFDGAFTSAQFALSLVEGVQKVRFIRQP